MSAARGPTRRTVLRAGPVALLAATAAAACTDDRPAARPAREPVAPSPVDPDDALRSAAAERERALLREYDAALLALPELAARLTPLRANHAQHLAAVLGPDSPTPTSSAAAPRPVPPPADVGAAVARLVAAERAASAAHGQDCLTASRDLAGVLASLSASELSHPVALT